MAIFLTSDLHFGHSKDFLWSPRGFQSSEEHDENIIKKYNSIITNEDDVYILGDLMLGDNDDGMKKLEQLNGNLYIVLGNHDTPTRVEKYKNYSKVKSVLYADVIKFKKWTFYLSHCPMIVSYEGDESKLWSLHGHTHSKDKFGEYYHCYNVALDAHDNYPIKLEDVIIDIQNKA